MFPQIFVSLSLVVQLVSGHFQFDYPYWRGNSFASPYSQFTYPCAGLNQSISANNRTSWPLSGGSLSLELHHPWTYVFINLGLGSDVTTNFNISLTPQFLNETGNGTLCIPQIILPSGLAVEGQNASIQIVTSGASGSALYNCADITFSSQASLLSSDKCQNSTGLSVSTVVQQVNGLSTTNASSGSSTSSSSAASASASAKSTAGQRFRVTSLWVLACFFSAVCFSFAL